jgi:hypothetical protein
VTESKAFALILISCLIVVALAIPGLASLGVDGPALSLGAIVPLALAANAISRTVMHFGDSAHRR